jgi:ABC-2 type transport system permease protein
MAARSPIADLSYRNVADVPLNRGKRWWVIARTHIMRFLKLRSFWILTVLSSIYYLMISAITYFIDSFSANLGGAEFAAQFFEAIVWKDQFLNGFQVGHFLSMAILLLIGSGSIANDNRSNALLVYFSKPCSKFDYLIGKFLGIFILYLTALLLPAIFFMFYGTMNFRTHGFLSDDPTMIPRVIAGLTLVSAFQASLALGISSIFNQGRLAGATYAGIYVLSGLFAGISKVVAQGNMGENIQPLLDKIHYLSIYGACEGLYKTILGTDGSFFVDNARRAEAIIPRPDLWLLILMTVVPATLCWFIAFRKVRAVEVVG